jgi:hypothetical protein
VTESTTAPSSLDALYYKRPVREHVREFGTLFAAVFLIVIAYRMWGGAPAAPLFLDRWNVLLALLAVASFVLGRIAPSVLLPVWRAWMKFAEILSMVTTPVIVTILWVVVVIPVALLLKVMRVRVMNTSFREPVDTYWESRDPKKSDFKLLERQF